MNRSQTLRDGGAKPCQCGESRPEVITGRGTSRGRCYECTVAHNGRERRTEEHHPFGRDNSTVAKITVDIPGNWHRAFDTRRAQRPDILKRPGDNPLHQIAAIVTTLGEAADTLADFARREKWPDWVAALADLFAHAAGTATDWLLILAGKLDERLGPAWAEDVDMPPWRL
jgi:hypothetical protein